MDRMVQGLEQAGYTIEANERDGDTIVLTFIKDGIRGRFAYPPEPSQEAADTAVEWISFKHESSATGAKP